MNRGVPTYPMGVADLIRACEALCDSRDALLEIATIMGWELAKKTPKPAPQAVADPPHLEAPESFDESPDQDKPETVPTRQTSTLTQLPPLERKSPVPTPTPKWVTERRPVALPFLYPSGQIKRFLAENLGQSKSQWTVDVDALVDQFARCEPIDKIPRCPVFRLARHIQVVIDQGDGMELFERDQDQVVQAVQEMYGNLVELFYCQRRPDKDLYEEPQGAILPSAQAAILLLSDLGISRSPLGRHFLAPKLWQELNQKALKMGSRVTALIPYAPYRWPQDEGLWQKASYWHLPKHRNQPSQEESFSKPPSQTYWSRYVNAWELAIYLSLASFIDPGLLRAARRQFMPWCGPDVEADLWNTPHVETHTSRRYIVLEKDLRHQLQKYLHEAGRLDDAWEFLADYRHQSKASEAVRAEERIHYLRWFNPQNYQKELPEIMEWLKTTMVEKNKMGIAHWATYNKELTEKELELPETLLLMQAASFQMRNRKVILPEQLLGSSKHVLPPDFPSVDVWAYIYNSHLIVTEVHNSESYCLTIPDTLPRWLQIQNLKEKEQLRFAEGESIRSTLMGSKFVLRTLDGSHFEISNTPPVKSHSKMGILAILIEYVDTAIDKNVAPLSQLETYKMFIKQIESIVFQHNGQKVSTSQPTDTYCFAGEGFRTKTLLAGIEILEAWDTFDLSTKSEYKASIKIAGHGTLDSPSSEEANLNELTLITNSLLSAGNQSDNFIVSDALFQKDQRERGLHFDYQGRYLQHPFYVYNTNSDRNLSQELMNFYREQGAQKCAEIRKILNKDYWKNAEKIKHVQQLFIELIELISEVCLRLSPKTHLQRDKSYLRLLLSLVSDLENFEHQIWHTLKTSNLQSQAENDVLAFRTVQKFIGSYRVEPLLSLAQLSRVLHRADREILERDSFEAKLHFALNADELDIEFALTDLQRNFNEELIAFLEKAEDQRFGVLKELIWYHNELFTHVNIFRVLIEADDPNFRVVSILSGMPNISDQSTIYQAFKNIDIDPDEKRFDTTMRLLATRHRNRDVRAWATSHLQLSSLWKLTYQARTSASVLYDVGMALRKRGNLDYERFFFDCTYPKIQSRLKKANSLEKIHALLKVIFFFSDMDFLIEDAYFARYDTLLRSVEKALKSMDRRDNLLKDMHSRLIDAHKNAENTKTKVPTNILDLPLPMQKQLAKLSHYFDRFIGSSDKRIALEVLRHTNVSNVSKILHRPDVNEALFRSILDQPHLFARPQNVFLALYNPKCSSRWAIRQLQVWFASALGRRQMNRIDVHRIQNPEIKGIVRIWKNRIRTLR